MEFNIKHYLIAAYIVITLILSVYLQEFGDHSDQQYSYNLGAAAMWPIKLVFFHHL